MKFSQLIEYNKRNIFIQKSFRKWGRETTFGPLFAFWKNFKWDKNKRSRYLSFNIFWFPSTWHTIKTNCIKSGDKLNFDFLEKCLVIVFRPHCVYDFTRKIFLMLYLIIWPNVIVWLHLRPEIWGNICIAIVCFSSCDDINFKILLIFLIKAFFTWSKYYKNLNMLRTKRDFKGKQKAFLIILKGFAVAKSCLRPKSVPIGMAWDFSFILLLPHFLWITFQYKSLPTLFQCLTERHLNSWCLKVHWLVALLVFVHHPVYKRWPNSACFCFTFPALGLNTVA